MNQANGEAFEFESENQESGDGFGLRWKFEI